MVQLMDLPHEIRLQIYEAVVKEDFEISIYLSQKSPRLRDAFSLRLIDKHLSDDIIPLYWSRNTFEYLDLFCFDDDEYLRRSWAHWLSRDVKEATRHIRRLEFDISFPSEDRCQDSSPSSANARSSCLSAATVDLGRRRDSAVQLHGDSTCRHAKLAYDRLMTVLSRVPYHNRQPQVTSALIMELFECTRKLDSPTADEGQLQRT